MKTIELVFFDAGGGHRSAANALSEVARSQSRPWEMRLMNLQELLDEMDVFRKITGVRLQDLYNLMLKKGWTFGTPQTVRVMQFIIRLLHGKTVRELFKSEPGVLVIGNTKTTRYRKAYTTLRIPASVAERVHRRLQRD